jgi:Tfp pilus assembly protein PilO
MNINWSSLTKEQKQITALIGVGAVILLVALYQFVLRPMVESAEQHKRELTDLRGNLDKAAKALEREMRTEAETAVLKQQLEIAERHHVAPCINTLSWVTEQIFQTAKEVGLEIDSVAGSGMSATSAGMEARTFLPFTSQTSLMCNYAELLRFLRALETKNPLVMITSLSVEGRAQKDNRQQVGLTLEWPTWAKPPAPAAAPSAAAGGKPKTP